MLNILTPSTLTQTSTRETVGSRQSPPPSPAIPPLVIGDPKHVEESPLCSFGPGGEYTRAVTPLNSRRPMVADVLMLVAIMVVLVTFAIVSPISLISLILGLILGALLTK